MNYLLFRNIVSQRQRRLETVEDAHRDWSTQRSLATCGFAKKMQSNLTFDWLSPTRPAGFAAQMIDWMLRVHERVEKSLACSAGLLLLC